MGIHSSPVATLPTGWLRVPIWTLYRYRLPIPYPAEFGGLFRHELGSCRAIFSYPSGSESASIGQNSKPLDITPIPWPYFVAILAHYLESKSLTR